MARPPKAGDVVTAIKLRNTYGGCKYAPTVVQGYLKDLPRKPRQARKYQIKEELPDRDEYLVLRQKRYTTDAEPLLSSAYSEIECVRDEVREWYDNLPEGLQQGDVGCRLEEAASTLENVEELEIPGGLTVPPIVFFPALVTSSRVARLAEAASMLRVVLDAVDGEQPKECGTCTGTGKVDCSGPCDCKVDCQDCKNEKGVDPDEYREFHDALESGVDDVEQVDVPSMFG